MLRSRLKQSQEKAQYSANSSDTSLPVQNESPLNKEDSKCSNIFTVLVVICFMYFVGVSTSSSSKLTETNFEHASKSLTPNQPIISKNNAAGGSSESSLMYTSDGTLLHMVFSTDCSGFQHWQSYLLFHSALTVGQTGYITRIASGCSDEEAEEARAWHDTHISSTMSDRFSLHLTPHFSSVKDENGKERGDYKFFNKPFGLLHWMENGAHLKFDTSEGIISKSDEDTVIILIDPDMLLMRPITHDFTDEHESIISQNRLHQKFSQNPRVVAHGNPYAQVYGLGTHWRSFNLDLISGSDSPAKLVSKTEASRYFPAGPPYLATAKDMHQIAVKWAQFAPHVHKQYPHLLAEMYAYCIAAAHLELPHTLVDSLMVSNVGSFGEGWDLVDRITPPVTNSIANAAEPDSTANMCTFMKKPDHSIKPLPSVIHFCQRYFVGRSFFSKRRMPTDFFTCTSPLMKEPPDNIVETADFGQAPGGEKKQMNKRDIKRNGFVVCGLLHALNDAGTFFKSHHCTNANLKKTLIL